jgi:predicted outer membrane lipoprotein
MALRPQLTQGRQHGGDESEGGLHELHHDHLSMIENRVPNMQPFAPADSGCESCAFAVLCAMGMRVRAYGVTRALLYEHKTARIFCPPA